LALTVRETAAAVGVSERLLRDLLPEIPHVRLGGRVVVLVDPFREWLRERAQQWQSVIDKAADEVLDGLAEER
jgi:hypothetical protein